MGAYESKVVVMSRFYVEYGSDHGWAIQSSHDVIECESHTEALATWPIKVRGKAVYDRLPPEACFEIPAFMREWDRDAILAHYRDASFSNQFVAPENENPFSVVVRKTRTWHDRWIGLRDTIFLRWG